MSVSFDAGTTPPTVRLEGVVDIGSAGELKERLLEALVTGAATEVALEGMTGLDVTTLQLLSAAETAARIRGIEWKRRGDLPASLRAVSEEAGWPGIPLTGQAE